MPRFELADGGVILIERTELSVNVPELRSDLTEPGFRFFESFPDRRRGFTSTYVPFSGFSFSGVKVGLGRKECRSEALREAYRLVECVTYFGHLR